MKKIYEYRCEIDKEDANEMRYREFDAPFEEFTRVDDMIGHAQSVKAEWQNFNFKFEENEKAICDFPYFDIIILAISERALNILRPLVEPYVEILPLNVVNSDLKFYGLNALKVYDVDLERSDYSMSNCDNNFYVHNVYVHAFPNDILPDAPIFRIIHTRHFCVYLSDDFRRAVEENNLIGLRFGVEMKVRTGPEKGKVNPYG